MPISFTMSPKQRIVGFCAKGRGSACASKCPVQKAPNNALLDSELGGRCSANVLYPKYCKCGFRYFLQTCDVRKGGRIPSTFRLPAEIFCLSHNMPISFTRSPKQRIVGFCAKGRGSACASKCPVCKILQIADFSTFYKHVTSEKEAEFLPLSDCLPKFFASPIICLSLLQGPTNNSLLDSELGGDVLQMSCIQNTANADFAIF